MLTHRFRRSRGQRVLTSSPDATGRQRPRCPRILPLCPLDPPSPPKRSRAARATSRIAWWCRVLRSRAGFERAVEQRCRTRCAARDASAHPRGSTGPGVAGQILVQRAPRGRSRSGSYGQNGEDRRRRARPAMSESSTASAPDRFASLGGASPCSGQAHILAPVRTRRAPRRARRRPPRGGMGGRGGARAGAPERVHVGGIQATRSARVGAARRAQRPDARHAPSLGARRGARTGIRVRTLAQSTRTPYKGIVRSSR